MTNPYSRSTPKPMRNGVDSFDTTFTEIPCGNSACGMQIFVFAASVSPTANVKLTSVVSIVVPSYRSATGWTLMNPETVFVTPSRMANLPKLLFKKRHKIFNVILVLILFNFFDSCTITLGIEHCTTQSIGAKCTFSR